MTSYEVARHCTTISFADDVLCKYEHHQKDKNRKRRNGKEMYQTCSHMS